MSLLAFTRPAAVLLFATLEPDSSPYAVPDEPDSFEVLSDETNAMSRSEGSKSLVSRAKRYVMARASLEAKRSGGTRAKRRGINRGDKNQIRELGSLPLQTRTIECFLLRCWTGEGNRSRVGAAKKRDDDGLQVHVQVPKKVLFPNPRSPMDLKPREQVGFGTTQIRRSKKHPS